MQISLNSVVPTSAPTPASDSAPIIDIVEYNNLPDGIRTDQDMADQHTIDGNMIDGNMTDKNMADAPSGPVQHIVSRTGTVYEPVSLRPFIRDDPDMQALNPMLKMRPRTGNPEDYTIFRTCIGKTVLDPKNPEDPEIDRIISDCEKAYVEYLDQARLFVSHENQIPQYRRVVFFGPAFSRTSGSSENCIGMAAVTNKGCLITGILQPKDCEAAQLSSVAEALEVLRVGREDWMIEDGKFYFNLNRHTKESRLMTQYGMGMIEARLCPVGQRSHSPLKGPCNRIMHSLRAQADRRLHLARWALCEALDPDVLRSMRGTCMTSTSHGRWLTGGDGATSEHARARQQAIRAYPILARQFFKDDLFRKTIDAREPLSPVIAKKYRAGKHEVKRLQGLTWQRAASSALDTGSAINDILSLPKGAVPKLRSEFRQIPVLEEFGRSLFGTTLSGTMEKLSQGGSPWRFIRQMEQTSGRNVRDAVYFLIDKLHVPASLFKIRRMAEDKGMLWKHGNAPLNRAPFYSEIISTYGIRDLLNLSDRYHRNIHRYEDQLDMISVNHDWPSMLGILDLGNGCIARELTSVKSLKTQGRLQNHCVGGYASCVLDGDRYSDKNDAIMIFSVEKDDEILSTIEIHCELRQEKSRTYLNAWVGQNSGYKNSDPSKTAIAMGKQIAGQIKLIAPNVFASYLDGLARVRFERDNNSAIDIRVEQCGFNPWNRSHLERAWTELAPVLPQDRRRAGLDAFVNQRIIPPPVIGWCAHENYPWDRIDEYGRFIDIEQQPDTLLQSERNHGYDGP